MPDAGQRFVEGALQTGGGISRALLKKYLMDYEQQEAEEEAALKKESMGITKMLGRAQADYYGAQTEALKQPEPEKPPTMEDLKVQAVTQFMETDPEKAYRVLFPELYNESEKRYIKSGGGVYTPSDGGLDTVLPPPEKEKTDKSVVSPLDYMRLLFGLDQATMTEDSPLEGLDPDSIAQSYMSRAGARLPGTGEGKKQTAGSIPRDEVNALKEFYGQGRGIDYDAVKKAYPATDIEKLRAIIEGE